MDREQRTLKQNKALHKYCELLAEALNDAGYEMKAVLEVKEVDVPWSKELVKEALWKPIQAAMNKGESTTNMDTKGPSEVYAVLDRHLASRFGIHIEWPSNEAPMIGG